LEKPVDILNNYFAVAAATLDTQNPEDIRSHAEVYYQYAIFAERQYQDILKSPDTLRYKIYKDRKYQEYKKRQQTVANAGGPGRVSRSNPDMVALKKSKEGYEEDERRYKEQTQTLVLFRGRAIEMFSRCMAVCDLYDDESIMRLISIWFSHFEESELYGKLEDAIARVPSHKFVFLAHQLSARLAVVDEILPTQDTPTQQAKVATTRTGQLLLRSLILRMCREHPFHSLYQVYCLRPARKHSGSQRRQSGRAEPGELREAAAEEIFSLLREDTACTHRVLAVEQLCDASLQWAQHPIKKEHEGKRPGVLRVPDKMLISKIRDLAAPVTTAHTPLDPTTKYSDCVWVSMYEQTYTTAGGINLPKISKCIGSDGVRYKQLVRVLPILSSLTNVDISLREKVPMICVRMLSWSRYLTLSIVFLSEIWRPNDETCASAGTR
jgi:ataxia telangiectasia mutated family protein